MAIVRRISLIFNLVIKIIQRLFDFAYTADNETRLFFQLHEYYVKRWRPSESCIRIVKCLSFADASFTKRLFYIIQT